jgi:hypothetical protein
MANAAAITMVKDGIVTSLDSPPSLAAAKEKRRTVL